MGKDYVRRIVLFEEHFKEFRKSLDRDTLKKVYQVFTLIMLVKDVPTKFLKYIVGYPGLYEIRIESAGNTYRVFCCLDEGNLVVLFNGFHKKSQKIPLREIEKAASLMKKYFESKR